MSTYTIEYQDREIILLNPYTYDGVPDGIFFKRFLPHHWNGSTIGDPYKVLWDRQGKFPIQITNEIYEAKYAAIETSLIGDVLILGAGLQTLDSYLTTGTSWKWIEKNSYLAAITPTNGTIYEADANDIDFLITLGTFDTILIDCPLDDNLKDYTVLLNPGGTIINFQI